MIHQHQFGLNFEQDSRLLLLGMLRRVGGRVTLGMDEIQAHGSPTILVETSLQLNAPVAVTITSSQRRPEDGAPVNRRAILSTLASRLGGRVVLTRRDFEFPGDTSIKIRCGVDTMELSAVVASLELSGQSRLVTAPVIQQGAVV